MSDEEAPGGPKGDTVYFAKQILLISERAKVSTETAAQVLAMAYRWMTSGNEKKQLPEISVASIPPDTSSNDN